LPEVRTRQGADSAILIAFPLSLRVEKLMLRQGFISGTLSGTKRPTVSCGEIEIWSLTDAH